SCLITRSSCCGDRENRAVTSISLDAATVGAVNDGGWPAIAASPFDTTSPAAAFAKSDSERTSRDEAWQALGSGGPQVPGPPGQSCTQVAPVCSFANPGKTVTAASSVASGSGIAFGFWILRRASNATASASAGGGPAH